MKLVIFGLTVSSSWGNGHATLWRGLCNALGRRGHRVVFFERDVPYGAHVTFDCEKGASGWEAAETAKWLGEAIDRASRAHFGKPALTWGEGGSIPFMGMLGERYPQAQFLITGVLGPHSNAHGPNEFLEIQTAKRLTACIAEVVAEEHSA